MSSKRIYLVTSKVGEAVESRLVEAPNQSQAVAHVVKTCVQCRVASQEDLVKHLPAGVPVEQAGPAA